MHRARRTRPRSRRGGLAPLELVLSLPLLMILMALMIVIGTAGSWKLRTHANSRQAAYRAIWPRNGENDAKPDSWWPASAAMTFRERDAGPFTADPFAGHRVVRGPVVGTGERSLEVINDTLDMTDGVSEGHASIDRELPLFRTLPYRNSYERSNQVFADEQWQHAQMRINNLQRRIPVTYEYDLARWDPATMRRMMLAVNDLIANPDRPLLNVLDRDDEILAWYGHVYVPFDDFSQYGPYSVYPRAAPFCNLSRCDCNGVNLRIHVDDLLERIDEVPCDLARLFSRMYQQQLDALPPGDPGRAAIEDKKRQVDEFLTSECR